jgi:hypothetical protein
MRKGLIAVLMSIIGVAMNVPSASAALPEDAPVEFLSSGSSYFRWMDITIDVTGLVAYAAQSTNSGHIDKIWKTTDGGSNWAALTSSPSANWVALDTSADGQIVYAISTDGSTWTLYKSVDGGETWAADSALTAHTQLCDVATSDNGAFVWVAFCDSHIDGSSVGGTSWQSFSVAGSVNKLDTSGGGTKVVAVGGTDAYIFDALSAVWSTRTVSTSSALSSVSVSWDGETIMLSSQGGPDADAWISTDGGLDFDPAGLGADYGSSVQTVSGAMSGDGTTMLWGWYNGPLKFSRDGGVTWASPLPPNDVKGWTGFAINFDGSRGVLGAEGNSAWNFRQPVPLITTVKPRKGEAPFPENITIEGSYFYDGCVVTLDGAGLPTTFVDEGTLSAQLQEDSPHSGEFAVICDAAASTQFRWAYRSTATTTTTVATTTTAAVTSTLPPTGRSDSNQIWMAALLITAGAVVMLKVRRTAHSR